MASLPWVTIRELIPFHSPSAESIIDKAIELNAIGGVYSNQKPTPFICLTLKLLQLQPEKEILLEYLLAEEFKWVGFEVFQASSERQPAHVRDSEADKSFLLPFFRYLRALAAFYIRLTFRSMDVYEILEPLMKDYRKLRERHMGQSFIITLWPTRICSAK